jgi:hypothetical protein
MAKNGFGILYKVQSSLEIGGTLEVTVSKIERI